MDTSPTRGAVPARQGRPAGVHRERLLVPWWGWLGALAAAGVIAAEIHLGGVGVRAWLPYLVLIPLALGLAGWLGRVRVEWADGVLRVDDAMIGAEFLLAAEPLDAEAKRVALGRELDPLAFVVHRPWVRGAVRIYLDDPADPTPYWVVSSHHPERLVAALGLPRPAPEPAAPADQRGSRGSPDGS
ncbi:MAG TPA: DUF3093 domain-containing protein [Cryptosporangiaceae bacterium]|nr:DUF3093 domain-containing protein [Cryptosporangiaceae bacterium]